MQRQIKSCTHCRQHKVRCDASKYYPKSCSRCSKFNLSCVIDQNFKPRKGGQVELLREHLAKIQEQIHLISQNGSRCSDSEGSQVDKDKSHCDSVDSTEHQEHHLKKESQDEEKNTEKTLEFSKNTSFPSIKRIKLDNEAKNKSEDSFGSSNHEIEASVAERIAASSRLVPIPGPYKLEDFVISEEKADELHNYFMENCSPYIPIFESSSSGELYARSEFLFWTVMITAALGEPSSDLYLSLVGPVKLLAAKKCLLATTRSSSVVQALLVLSTWPLPSEKILEDMSPRYASLAYSMGLQLGIHRGKFIYEFSRNQQLMPNAVKWRSRTWVQTYITQQMVSAASGIPASMPVDYIIDHSLHDETHPLSPRTSVFLKISMFYSKLVSIMGSRITSQDGLMEPESRCPTLDLLRTDLDTMFPPSTDYNDPVIEIMLLYARCIMDNFAFLPETPLSYQSGFLIDAFQASTRIVTLVRQLVGNRKIMEFPSFIRNPCNYAALTLFRLQSMPQVPDQYIISARESVITIHHMYRNIPPSWLDSRVSNDISRVAKILESLNHVMMTHPELFKSRRVMRKMRSHLTFSLFYELVYIIHEARRRNVQKINSEGTSGSAQPKHSDNNSMPLVNEGSSDGGNHEGSSRICPKFPSKGNIARENDSPDSWAEDDSPVHTGAMHQLISNEFDHRVRDLNPLPLFNNIDCKSYSSSTVISPNGTTLTNLVPVPHEGRARMEPVNDSPTSPNIPHSHALATQKDMTHRFQSIHDKATKYDQKINSSDAPLSGKSRQQAERGDTGHNLPLNQSIGPMNPHGYVEAEIYGEGADPSYQQVFGGLDWMNTEGDDFLGWMMPRNE